MLKNELNNKKEALLIAFLILATVLPHIPLNQYYRALHPFFNFKLFAAEYKPLTQIYSLRVLNCNSQRKLIYPHDIFLEGNFASGEKKYRYFRRFEALYPLLDQHRYDLVRKMIIDIATHSQLNYRGCEMGIFRGTKKDESKRWTETDKNWVLINETKFQYN